MILRILSGVSLNAPPLLFLVPVAILGLAIGTVFIVRIGFLILFLTDQDSLLVLVSQVFGNLIASFPTILFFQIKILEGTTPAGYE